MQSKVNYCHCFRILFYFINANNDNYYHDAAQIHGISYYVLL